jgi:hypothetical protein
LEGLGYLAHLDKRVMGRAGILFAPTYQIRHSCFLVFPHNFTICDP